MMLPIVPLAVPAALVLELPPRLASELSTNEEMIDCALGVVADEVEPELAPDAAAPLPSSVASRFWKAELRLEVTLLVAPEPASRLPSSWLSTESVARLVRAATVAATLEAEAVALAAPEALPDTDEPALEPAGRLA